MKDRFGNTINIGDRIVAIKTGYDNHLLKCHNGFCIDLSDPVTVRVDDRGILMAGCVSLNSYSNRLFEIVKE
jgi:hypothetical protein